MLTKVQSLEKVGGFKLRVVFNDGTAGSHDFAPMVGESGSMMEPLRDPAFFQRVFLEYGALTWPNGFDIAPEWLRREMSAAGELNSVSSPSATKKRATPVLSRYSVLPSKEGWAVRRADAVRSSAVFTSQSEAIAWARNLVRRKNSELVIYGKDGQIRDRTRFGSDPTSLNDKATKSSSARGQKRA
jgi:hypothetical protein